MNKFMRLSLLTRRLSDFLKVAVMQRGARDPRPVLCRVMPANPEALLPADVGRLTLATVSRRGRRQSHCLPTKPKLQRALIAQLRQCVQVVWATVVSTWLNVEMLLQRALLRRINCGGLRAFYHEVYSTQQGWPEERMIASRQLGLLRQGREAMHRSTRAIATTFLSVAIIGVCLSVSAQPAKTTAQARTKTQSVDVGGHKLWLQVAGTGPP